MEFVNTEAKIVYILECLRKTPPPVLIFAERKQDVDAIQEYLLLKGVQAVSTHGGKDQEERTRAVQQFKNKEKDILVATDVASKGKSHISSRLIVHPCATFGNLYSISGILF